MEFVGIDVVSTSQNTAIVNVNRTFQMKVSLDDPQNVPWTFIPELHSRKKPQRKSLSTIQIIFSYNQSHVTFCLHLRRSWDVEHACLGSGHGTTVERHSRYNLQLHTRPSCRQFPRLNTNLSYFFEKRITKEGFQQDRCSQNLPFSVIYRKTAERNLPERKEFLK
ncbi:hypothetical protein TNCV_3791991 [Trichonephila clavipes]|nr:hypothetical protein TNCV_3791991 [Trichonephila clavipes]